MSRNDYGENYNNYGSYSCNRNSGCSEHEEDCDTNLIIILLIIIIILLQGLQTDTQSTNITSLIKDSGELLGTLKELL